MPRLGITRPAGNYKQVIRPLASTYYEQGIPVTAGFTLTAGGYSTEGATLAITGAVATAERVKAPVTLAVASSLSGLAAVPVTGSITAAATMTATSSVAWSAILAASAGLTSPVHVRPAAILDAGTTLVPLAQVEPIVDLASAITVTPLGYPQAVAAMHVTGEVTAGGHSVSMTTLTIGTTLTTVLRIKSPVTLAIHGQLIALPFNVGIAVLAPAAAVGTHLRVEPVLILAATGVLTTTEIAQVVNYWMRYSRSPDKLSKAGGVMGS